MHNIKKRTLSFWKSDSSLTSRRVSIILSNSNDSDSLAESIRNNRHSGKIKGSFIISKDSQDEIEKELELELELE
jgi:hypothetical protein